MWSLECIPIKDIMAPELTRDSIFSPHSKLPIPMFHSERVLVRRLSVGNALKKFEIRIECET